MAEDKSHKKVKKGGWQLTVQGLHAAHIFLVAWEGSGCARSFLLCSIGCIDYSFCSIVYGRWAGGAFADEKKEKEAEKGW
ncbi:MAG: hypothetical protein JXN61_00890 [Sedimentisphaerales bacterium]|nr:hypothetical protein [Sedimentisphaerales bacterium]